MDIRDRVMGEQPNDFLHKIASKVPGYNGYVDKERRRDADKLLRTELARRYSGQRDRLNRVQQTLARNRQFEQIAEVDRVTGVFQRFIDRLNTATYGYTGLFDPVKVEGGELDQIYAFDLALADGVDTVSTAIGAVESAATPATGGGTPELAPAVSRLAEVVDELNTRLSQRSDYLTSGKRVPESEFRAMVGGPSGAANVGRQPAAQPSAAQPSGQAYQGYSAPPTYGQAQGYEPAQPPQAPQPQQPPQYGQATQPPPQGGYGSTPNMGGGGYGNTENTGNVGETGSGGGYGSYGTYEPPRGGQGYEPNSGYTQQNYQTNNPYQQAGGQGMSNEANLGSGGYSQPGGATDIGSGDSAGGSGVPTTNLNMQTDTPNQPGMGQMVSEGTTPSADMQSPQGMNPTETPASGIQTASSPSHATDPGAPAHAMDSGLTLSESMGTPDTTSSMGSMGTGNLPGESEVDSPGPNETRS